MTKTDLTQQMIAAQVQRLELQMGNAFPSVPDPRARVVVVYAALALLSFASRMARKQVFPKMYWEVAWLVMTVAT